MFRDGNLSIPESPLLTEMNITFGALISNNIPIDYGM